jgi:choloylglycine hydrolase
MTLPRGLAAILLLAFGAAAPWPRMASACTTFCYADGGTLVFGRNYDWNLGDGLVLINRRGVSKRALTRDGAVWTSKHGSITFNQYGREFPTGGMNEAGLVVELMWLEEAQYPGVDARAALPTLQWIQYQLDNSATVDEVIAFDRVVRISAASAKIHFLVADAAGAVATIEFLGGGLVVHRGADLPYPVLTNDTYQRSVQFARAAGRRVGMAPAGSLERFARAASAPRTASTPAEAVRRAFALLDDVAQGGYTQWSIVYDMGAKRVHFRTATARRVRWIDLYGMGLECDRPVSMLDVNAPLEGDVTRELAPYTPDANRALVLTSFAKTPFLESVPAQAREEMARYPETTTCAGRGPDPRAGN